MPKCKYDPCRPIESSDSIVTKTKCIIHASELSTHGPFTALSNIKGDAKEKLKQLHEIRDKRLSQPLDSSYRMDNICEKIPDSLPDELNLVGYHRVCYQRFTSNLTRLNDSVNFEASSSVKHRSPRKASTSGVTSLVFPPECIFCEQFEIKTKQIKSKTRKTERAIGFPSWKNKENAWAKIEQKAYEMGDDRLYRLVKDQDLFAVEAKHHPSCLAAFKTSYANLERSHQCTSKSAIDSDNLQVLEAHNKAFSYILNHVRTHILKNKEVILLSSMRLMYIEQLKENGYENDNYRSEKLLKRLQKDPISKDIGFIKMFNDKNNAISFWLVHSSDITISDAIKQAYSLGNSDKYLEAALNLRSCILKAFKESRNIPWPPTPEDMEVNQDEILPGELTNFLSLLLRSKEYSETTDKTKRLIHSIGQDISRALTEGEWLLPKHVLLCATVRHLYRSKQLTEILHRLGHCESYKFGLEMETALSKAMDDISTFVTPHIVKGEGNQVFHCEWDNLNKKTTNIHGSNIVNSAGGIMIQEVKPGFSGTGERTLPTLDRAEEKRKIVTPETIPPLHFKRIGPPFNAETVFTPLPELDVVYSTQIKGYYAWLFSRSIGSSGRQPMPMFGGFISATGIPPPRKTTIDYFTPIHQPITEYAVVRELLKRSEKATDEVGQKWVFSTFDLGVCMKSLPILWRYPQEFSRHVITIGPFHTSMNHINMLTNNKLRGSGYTDILIEAQMVTTGSLKGVLSGKSYAKSLYCLKTVCEGMERLLMEQFFKEEDRNITNPGALLELTQSCDREKLDTALADDSTKTLIDKYCSYEEKVRTGHLGKTAAFWMSFIDHCHRHFMLLLSIKTNNLKLFHKCNGDMAEIFFAFDGMNYSRYLVWQDIFLANLEETHPGARDKLTQGGLAVARSMMPGALSAVDKTMEETFMRFAKSPGGFTGLYSKFGAYQRWCRTTAIRAQFYEKILDMVDLGVDLDNPKAGRHREREKAEIRKGEDAVQRVMTAVRNFSNPFDLNDDMDKEKLYTLASGAPVPPEVEIDVLRAEAAGKDARQAFVDRLRYGLTEGFFDPIKRNNLKTMEACNKTVKLTSSQGKIIQYQEQSNLAFLLLVKSQDLDEPIDLDELMKYCILPVPPSLATPDGFFCKTSKASMLHYILEDLTPNDLQYPRDAFFIQDGMALLHVLTDIPPSWGELCLKVLDQMIDRKNFLFSTDSYHPNSIKAQERLRRGISERSVLSGPATRVHDYKKFLTNDQNKNQLCQLMLRVWSDDQSATRIAKSKMSVLIVEGKAHQLTATNGKVQVNEISEIASDQEETDTRVVLYLHYAAVVGYTEAVVRSPDTDILFILLFHANNIPLTVYLDTGSGKNRQLVNVSELAESLGEDYCTTLLGLYVFTGEDCTSAFKGKGKVTPLKKLEKNPRFHRAFRELGEDWIVGENTCNTLEQFTCLMYGQHRESSIDMVRAKLLRGMVGENKELTSKSKVDLARLPPCKSALIPHIQRVNHRVALYKRAHQPTFNKPLPYDDGQGWLKKEEGIIEPLWSNTPVLPPSLIDLLESNSAENDNEDENDDDLDIDFEDYLIESDDE